MRKATKGWLIVATALLLVGLMIFGGAMTVLKWDFTKLSTSKYETNEYGITEAFRSISVRANTADVTFVPSDRDTCSVVCYELTNQKHSVSVEDGTLVIEVKDTRKWYEYIGIQFGSPKITVYLPGGEYEALSVQSDTGDVKIPGEFSFESMEITQSTGNVTNEASVSNSMRIKTTTGDICVKNLSAGSLSLSVSTGEVTVSGVRCEGELSVSVSTGKTYLTDVTCQSLISRGSTGNLSLTGVTASERFSLERSTGDVTMDGCDAAELWIRTDTGDVEGSLLSSKIFLVTTDTGDKEVPSTVTGGKCEIITDTGDVRIRIQ